MIAQNKQYPTAIPAKISNILIMHLSFKNLSHPAVKLGGIGSKTYFFFILNWREYSVWIK